METDLITESASSLPELEQVSPLQLRYLSYRIAGFSLRESCYLSGVSERTVENWRKADQTFSSLDIDSMSRLRKDGQREILRNEFIRNFMLVMRKDAYVIEKSITAPEDMSRDEQSYLLKLRANYTPQQLALISQWAKSNDTYPEMQMNFTQMVLNYSRAEGNGSA